MRPVSQAPAQFACQIRLLWKYVYRLLPGLCIIENQWKVDFTVLSLSSTVQTLETLILYVCPCHRVSWPAGNWKFWELFFTTARISGIQDLLGELIGMLMSAESTKRRQWVHKQTWQLSLSQDMHSVIGSKLTGCKASQMKEVNRDQNLGAFCWMWHGNQSIRHDSRPMQHTFLVCPVLSVQLIERLCYSPHETAQLNIPEIQYAATASRVLKLWQRDVACTNEHPPPPQKKCLGNSDTPQALISPPSNKAIQHSCVSQ